MSFLQYYFLERRLKRMCRFATVPLGAHFETLEQTAENLEEDWQQLNALTMIPVSAAVH
jgi:hypothetical protein